MSPSVEAFNEAKYKALMDGLECNEVMLHALENHFTIGSEYYAKNYVAMVETIKKCAICTTLGEASVLITDGDHGAPDYQENGVLYLLSESVKEGYIDKSKCRFITEEKNRELRRSELHPSDVVVTKTGVYFGKSAVIPDTIRRANTIAHVGKITLHENHNAYYVSTFLNCKYGYSQMRRRGIKATRPEMKLVEYPDILIPVFSANFYCAIESIVRMANDMIEQSERYQKEAGSKLLEELGITGIESQNSIVIKNLLETFAQTGRLDAEYYQPKYDLILHQIMKGETTTIPQEFYILKNSFTNYSEGRDSVGVVKTKQVGNAEIDLEGIESTISEKNVIDNKLNLLMNGDVVFAAMGVGSLGKVSVFTNNRDEKYVTDSTLRIFRKKKNGRILPEILALFLQSKIGQELIYRYIVGSTGIINIYDTDVARIPIPVLTQEKQQSIVEIIQKVSFIRKQAKDLLSLAKSTVEMAIEQGEQTAIDWLAQKEAE